MNKQLALLKEFIIGTVTDDYESFEMLTQEIRHWPDRHQKAFSRELLIDALKQVIQDNAVVPYLYNAELNRMEKAVLDVNCIDDYWFLISEEAKPAL